MATESKTPETKKPETKPCCKHRYSQSSRRGCGLYGATCQRIATMGGFCWQHARKVAAQ